MCSTSWTWWRRKTGWGTGATPFDTAAASCRRETDRNGGTTAYSYCACGGVASVTDPQTNSDDLRAGLSGPGDERGERGGERGYRAGHFGPGVACEFDLGLGRGARAQLPGLAHERDQPGGPAWAVVFDEADLPVGVTDGRGVRRTI